MQPASIPLSIVQGATLRESIRVMQSQFEYRPITGISSTAPVVLTFDHGLPMDWPVWVQGVQGLQEVNRGTNQVPWLATVVDVNSLEINAVSADGRKPTGGMLVYHPPVDLAGTTALLQVLDEKGSVVLEFAPTVHPGGWIDINLSAEQTAEMSWRKGTWQLDASFPNGDVVRLFAGPASVSPPGTVPTTWGSPPSLVYTFGTQGPAGAGDVSALLELIEAQQLQINELYDLVNGGGALPASVVSGGKTVVSNGAFVVSSGVH